MEIDITTKVLKKNDMKQTAVEWLVEQITSDKFVKASDQIEIINQAIEMEKEQIKKAVYFNCSAMSHSDLQCWEEFFLITFKSE